MEAPNAVQCVINVRNPALSRVRLRLLLVGETANEDADQSDVVRIQGR